VTEDRFHQQYAAHAILRETATGRANPDGQSIDILLPQSVYRPEGHENMSRPKLSAIAPRARKKLPARERGSFSKES
jgi:hypothetical protein